MAINLKNFKVNEQLRKWLDSVNRFLQAWSIVRICPDRINAPRGHQSFNVLTLTVSLAIFVLARKSVAGSDTGVEAVVIATMISVMIVFMVGYVNLVLRPGPNSIDEAKKWGTFFVMAWLTSLLLLILFDAIPLWFGYSPGSTIVFDTIFGSDAPSPVVRDFARAVLFGAGALMILYYKTRRMDQSFRTADRCTVITLVIGLAVNTFLMGGFIYGHFI
jgi:hypothetical protein